VLPIVIAALINTILVCLNTDSHNLLIHRHQKTYWTSATRDDQASNNVTSELITDYVQSISSAGKVYKLLSSWQRPNHTGKWMIPFSAKPKLDHGE